MSTAGIIGAGRLGQAMARTALRAGRDVVISDSRGPESLASVVSALGDGVSAGTADEVASADIVVIAVPWDRVPRAVRGLNWNGQVVIDATNDWAADDLGTKTSSEVVTGLVAGARVVKAANTLSAEVLESDPQQAGGRRVIFISGKDADAKADVVAHSRTPASLPSTSATSQRAARCNRSTIRSRASTSFDSEEFPPMAMHTELSSAEAAGRLTLRELFDAYAHCADRRDAEGPDDDAH